MRDHAIRIISNYLEFKWKFFVEANISIGLEVDVEGELANLTKALFQFERCSASILRYYLFDSDDVFLGLSVNEDESPALTFEEWEFARADIAWGFVIFKLVVLHFELESDGIGGSHLLFAFSESLGRNGDEWHGPDNFLEFGILSRVTIEQLQRTPLRCCEPAECLDRTIGNLVRSELLSVLLYLSLVEVW